MSEGRGACGAPITSAVVTEVAATAVHAASADVVVVIVIVTTVVAPRLNRAYRLHRDLRPGFSRGVEGLGAGVIFCPELHCGLHGDLGLLGKAAAAVARGRRVIGRRRRAIRWRRAVLSCICSVQIRLRFYLNHSIGTWAGEINRETE